MQGAGGFFIQLRGDGRGLLFEARLALPQLLEMLFQLQDAGGLNIAHLGRFGGHRAERLPFGLPVLHGALGLAAISDRRVACADIFFELRRQLVEPALHFIHARHVRLQMGARLAPRAVDLFLFAQLVLARLARVLDGLLEARDLGAHGIELRLHRVEAVHRLGLLGADFFDLGFDAMLPRQRQVERVLQRRDLAIVRVQLLVELEPAQRQQLRLHEAFFLFQFLVARGGLGLLLQFRQLRLEFLADVFHAREILARVLDAAFGLAPAFLVFRNARGFLDEAAQILGLGLDDARHHALLDDRVGARSQAGAEENVGDVLAPALGAVEIIIGLAVAPGLAADGDFGVTGVLTAGRSVAVVEDELHGGRGHRLARIGAVENDIGHGIAAQVLGGHLAHDPAHRVDDVGFAATVRADDADQVAGNGNRDGFDKRLEAGKLDCFKSHRVFA